jgi:Lar family restriction alleviation protein
MNVGTELKPCPFCGGHPSLTERPDNIDGTEFFCAVACYCGGYSACAHKMARCTTADQARDEAVSAWNRRAPHTMELAKEP